MSAATLRPRSSLGLSLPRAGNSTAVLLAALGTVAATAWAVMSAGWVDGTGAMLLTAVAGVLEAALVARSSVGRLVALLLLPVVGTLVVVPLTYGSMPGADSITLGDAAQEYVNALTTGLFVQADWAFLVGLCGVFWLIGSWTGWMAVRERRGVLAVLPTYAVLAVNALNAPSLEHVAVPEAVAVMLSLVVVGRVHLLDLSARWRRSGVVPLPGTERRFGRVTLVAAVVLLLAAVIAPPASTRDISGIFFKFNQSGGRHGAGTGSGGNAGGTGTAPGTVRFDPSTVPGGPLVSVPAPVLAYTTDSTQNLYLRVVNDNYFTQGNWFPSGPSNGDNGVSSIYLPDSNGQIPRDRDPVDGGVGTASSLQQVTVKVVLSGNATGSTQQLGIFPGEPDATSLDGAANGLTSDSSLDKLLTVDQYRVVDPQSTFTSSATLSTATADQLRDAGTDYPDFVTREFLDLNPQGGGDRAQIATLRTIARQWTVGQSNPYDMAAAIERQLRDTSVFTYTLKPPATRAGLWPIVDFLTRTHAGYCQYYASAMGALLRVSGIPARLVSGYGPGTVDDSRTGSTLHSVTTSDAHVWVEAYFPKYGWVPFEPTPDGVYNPIARGADQSTSTTVPPPTPASTHTPTPRPTSTPQANPGAAGGATGATLPPGLLGGGLSLVFILAVLLVLRRWVANPRTLTAMWRRVAALGVALGVRRRSSETYAAYVGRLCEALPPDTTTLGHRDGSAEIGPRPVRALTVAALEQLAAAHGKAEFSARGLSEREAVQWRRAWNRVWRHVPLLMWRSVLARSARRGTGAAPLPSAGD